MDSAENVKSQNRILNCFLRDQLKSLGSLDFPFSLESLLSITADKNKTIVLAVAGYSYKDMLMSWVCRLRLLQVTNFIICALDHETYQFSVLQYCFTAFCFSLVIGFLFPIQLNRGSVLSVQLKAREKGHAHKRETYVCFWYTSFWLLAAYWFRKKKNASFYHCLKLTF